MPRKVPGQSEQAEMAAGSNRRNAPSGGLVNRLIERWMPAERRALRHAGRMPAAMAFRIQPEPQSIGLFGRGKQLISGNFLFSGILVQAAETPLWDLDLPDEGAAADLQGFGWLDDLAAVGDGVARARAQAWVWDWIARFGTGQGTGKGRGTGRGAAQVPVWRPDLTGRRVLRLINHSAFLLAGREAPQAEAYFRSLSMQTAYLSQCWARVPPGLARFEALTGLIMAGLALKGMEGLTPPALAALEQDCATFVDAGGGIAARNPEELLEIFTLLIWAAKGTEEAGHPVGAEHRAAITRIAPTLRALRHADGGLARFHGGGRGVEGRLEHSLAASGVRAGLAPQMAMGFARLGGGRTSVIVDAAPPPQGAASRTAHASTLAFELTSGRRPVIVSSGSGLSFGAEWRLAGRATASHSTLSLDGVSSSRLGVDPEARRQDPAADELAEVAAVPVMRLTPGEDGLWLHAAHTGWARTHGLIHLRDLVLSDDGRDLTGVETLSTTTASGRHRFGRLAAQGDRPGIGVSLRFHLHPDVDAALDLGGTAASLALKSGEIWVFRHDGRGALSLEPSVYLERGRLKPRPTRQIVLSLRALDFETRIGWTLAKAQDTPLAIRDLERDDLPVPL